ncbi:MAG: sensor domain-containing diguanylate cyclase [Alicyclobacillus sp.]|nr:sensor domain-containing diguanylate cyclase [Alicyclobacillus sp.]
MTAQFRKCATTAALAATAAVETAIAVRCFPWRLHMGLLFWTSLLVLGLAEWLPARTASSRFHFRTGIQLLFFAIYGWFPLLAATLMVTVIDAIVQLCWLRTFTLNASKWMGALVAPAVLTVLTSLFFGRVMPSTMPMLGLLCTGVAVYWGLAAAVGWLPWLRAPVHPWRAGRGWALALVGLDAWLAANGLLELSDPTWWSGIVVNVEMALVIIIVYAYVDSSIRRMRMTECAALATRLSSVHSLPELVHEGFQVIGRLLCADAVTLWAMDEDLLLRPAFAQAYTDEGKALADQHLTERPAVPRGLGLAGFCVSSRDVLVVSSARQKVKYDWRADREMRRSALAAPVILEGEVYGALCVYHCSAESVFRRRDGELLLAVGEQLSSMLGNLWRFEQTRIQSEIDELTGLYNYRYFDEALKRAVEESDQLNRPVSLLVIDIDHFKLINDRYGHLAGNQVLRSLASMITEMVRDGDVVARYGGEEFTVLLPGLTTHEARVVAERIRERVEQASFHVEDSLSAASASGSARQSEGRIHHRKLKLTLSIGVACYPESADSALTLIRHADRAMYIGSKQRGRNRVSAYGHR